jgi:hypothetical protein
VLTLKFSAAVYDAARVAITDASATGAQRSTVYDTFYLEVRARVARLISCAKLIDAHHH